MKCSSNLPDFRSVLRYAPVTAILWAYLVLALTIDVFDAPSWHDGQRLLQLAALFLIAVFTSGVSRTHDGGAPLEMPGMLRWALGCALALGLVSAAFAPWPRWALLDWAMTALLFLVTARVANEFSVNTAVLGRLTVAVAYAAALLYGLKSIFAYVLMFAVGADYGLGFDAQELFPGFSNVRFFGHVQTMLLPLLVLPALWWGRSALQRAGWMLVPALWWMLAIASGTRGSWVALGIGAVVAVIAGRAQALPWLRMQMLGLLSGGILYVFFVLGVPEWLARPAVFLHREAADLVSLRGREVLWGLSLDWAAVHPWLGLGPMHFANRLTELASHPHNAVLQWVVEWGIPAAVLFTLFFAYAGLRFFMKVSDRLPRSAGTDCLAPLALLAALTGAAAQAMVDGVLVMPVSQMSLVLLAGWAWAWCFSGAGAADAAQISRRGLGLAAAMTVLTAVVVLSSLPEVLVLQERLEEHMRNYPGGPNPRLLPRFWIHGWIPE